MNILYNYTHCPYCIRVRLSLGYLNIPYSSVVLPYNDESTPKKLTGKKMLPIFVMNDQALNESLNIISILDTKRKLFSLNLTQVQINSFDQYLSKIGESIHSLCMPYWIFTPEFDKISRMYFQKKKEVKRGPFSELISRSEEIKREVDFYLTEIGGKISGFYQSDKISILDIMLASHLWGLYVIPEFQFPQKIHTYLQNIKLVCQFTYWDHFEKQLCD